MTNSGARPVGAVDEATASAGVRRMFDAIAPRYDLLNHLLSADVDRYWRRRAARRFKNLLADPEAAVLDLCCGTGDMTLAMLKLRPQNAKPILAADFSRAMLAIAEKKFAGRNAAVAEADAMQLPLADGAQDLIVTAFGFRNLSNYAGGLREFHRVLKPGGQLGILEFSEPGGWLGRVYALYFRRVLPMIGRAVCGQDGPYSYLPASVGKFPAPEKMLAMMHDAGYVECAWRPYTFGVAGLYTARRPDAIGG